MRRSFLVFLLFSLLIIGILVRSVWTLLSLLVEDAAADAIHGAELPSLNSSLTDQRPQMIPKIIHQTYKDENIPEVWLAAQKSCIDLHPDYEYIVRLPLDQTGIGANDRDSCGRMKNRVTLSLPNTPGFSKPLTATHILSNAQTRFAISFWPTMAESTLIWTTYSYPADIISFYADDLTHTGLQSSFRSPISFPGVATPHYTNWDLQRCNGLRTPTPLLPARNRITSAVRSQMASSIYHRHVFDWAAFPISYLERVYTGHPVRDEPYPCSHAG
jgi:hypothetical protein